jgi:hypothetical protein
MQESQTSLDAAFSATALAEATIESTARSVLVGIWVLRIGRRRRVLGRLVLRSGQRLRLCKAGRRNCCNRDGQADSERENSAP